MDVVVVLPCKYMNKEHKEWLTNRDRKREPKKGKFWCNVCDMFLIHKGQRCPVCKRRDLSKTNKK